MGIVPGSNTQNSLCGNFLPHILFSQATDQQRARTVFYHFCDKSDRSRTLVRIDSTCLKPSMNQTTFAFQLCQLHRPDGSTILGHHRWSSHAFPQPQEELAIHCHTYLILVVASYTCTFESCSQLQRN